MRTLRVRELCRHDLELFSVNNQLRNLDAHIGSHIFYEDLYRSNRITTYVVPFVIGMLLARDSIVGISIPSSISLPASLFTRSVTHIIPWSTPWSHCAHYDDVLPSGPRDTSPLTRSDKSQSRFVPTQQTLSEIPVVYLYSHPVTLWRLIHPKHSTVSRSYTISWSKEEILDIGKALANELHDLLC